MEKGQRRECASLWEGEPFSAPSLSVWPRKATKSVAAASLSKPLQRSCVSAVLFTGQEPGTWCVAKLELLCARRLSQRMGRSGRFWRHLGPKKAPSAQIEILR